MSAIFLLPSSFLPFLFPLKSGDNSIGVIRGCLPPIFLSPTFHRAFGHLPVAHLPVMPPILRAQCRSADDFLQDSLLSAARDRTKGGGGGRNAKALEPPCLIPHLSSLIPHRSSLIPHP